VKGSAALTVLKLRDTDLPKHVDRNSYEDIMEWYNGKTFARHYKTGDLYEVLHGAIHSETLEEMIVYRHVTSQKIWVRPLHMFFDRVEYKGKTVPRFEALT
jgi:hypothetical protein